MKILHIISGDLWGGAETVAYSLCIELSKEPHNSIYVILFNNGKLEKLLSDNGVSTFVLDESKYSNLRIFAESLSYIKTIKPDIIHTHKHKENVLGATLGFCLGIPSIRTFHGSIEQTPRFFEIHKYIYNFLDWGATYFFQKYIVSVSQELSLKIQSAFKNKNIIVVSNGIYGEKYDTSTNCTPPPKSSTKHIAIICRLTQVKRIDIFLEVAKYFSHYKNYNIVFDIYGDGPQLEEINTFIKSNNIEVSVNTHGFIDNINDALKKTHVLLITSDHEGLPINLLEAVFSCVPVIAHSVGDIPSVLGHGRYGTLIQRNEPKEYVNSIKHFIAEPAIYTKKAKLGKLNATKNYTVKCMADSYYKIYNKLLSG